MPLVTNCMSQGIHKHIASPARPSSGDLLSHICLPRGLIQIHTISSPSGSIITVLSGEPRFCGKYYQCPYTAGNCAQVIESRPELLLPNSIFLISNPPPKVWYGPAGFLTPPAVIPNVYFTNSEELVIILSLSRRKIHASHQESLRPGPDKAKWSLCGFLHSSGFIEQQQMPEGGVL